MNEVLRLINRKWVSIPQPLSNAIITIVIFLASEIGRLLSIHNLILPISLVWPATGFSLATMLLFGFEGSFIGIILGNFLSNFLHLYLDAHSIGGSSILSFVVAFGSLIQAMLGTYLIRRFSSREHFVTLHDMYIFLIPVGLLSSLTAPFIGVLALYFYGAMAGKNMLQSLITFWVGDSMGVYIFAPLLVVWAIHKPHVDTFRYGLSLVGMLSIFILLSLLCLVYYYPLWYLFIPLAIWITYRFRMHGATVAIFLITLTAIITYSLGFGSFQTLLVKNPLIILVSFLETIVACSLVLAAALNEREAAISLIRGENLSLRNTMLETKGELAQNYNSMFIKLKFVTALDQLALHLTKHIRLPLANMGKYIKESLDCSKLIQKQFLVNVPEEKYFTFLNESLQNIEDYQVQADKIAKIIQKQSVLTTKGLEQVRSIDINEFIEACLLQVQTEATKQYPDFNYKIVKTLDPFIAKVLILPEDLAYALIILMEQGIDALKAKEHHVIGYEPELKVETIYQIDTVQIILNNNGLNDTDDLPEYFSQSFFDYKVPKNLKHAPSEALGLNLVLAHDIIVHVHRGKIAVKIFENKHLELVVTLPIESEY